MAGSLDNLRVVVADRDAHPLIVLLDANGKAEVITDAPTAWVERSLINLANAYTAARRNGLG